MGEKNANSDVVLRLQRQGFFKKRCAIVVAAPPERAKTRAGTLKEPPEIVKSDYSRGNIDVVQTANWVRECIGDSIFDVIRQSYGQIYPKDSERLRIVVTAADLLRSDMMKVPWELLESLDSAHGLPYGERTSVVRVLYPEEVAAEPTLAGDRLRIAVLWTNPFEDIPDLRKHLDQLERFIELYPSELSLIGSFEVVSTHTVRDALADKHPHIVYYIGHAVQQSGRKVELKIGRAGAPTSCNVEDFRSLLQEIGPPRLLVLSSCAGTIGYELNPYLGAALSCAEQIDAVVSMQTMVPVDAAMLFAAEFFRGLVNANGLAQSVKRGRYAIQRGEIAGGVGQQSFAPFIPVLLQRTKQDHLFTIDLSGRQLRRILLLLKQSIQKIDLYLERAHDEALMNLLRNPGTALPVTVVRGPTGSGKSTSLRRAISTLLTEERFKAGDRYLYYEANPTDLPAVELTRQIHHLLVSFANHFLPLTHGLNNQLAELYKARPESALVVFASWLDEEYRDGKRYRICLDNLRSELAARIADRASRVFIKEGSLLLISKDPEIEANSPIKQVLVAPMAATEVRAALERKGLSSEVGDVARIIAYSNGLPFFVAGYVRRGIDQTASSDDLAKTFLESRLPNLSDKAVEVLRFAALCDTPVPQMVLEELYPRDVVRNLTDEEHLLINTADGSYQLPDALREYLLSSTSTNDAIALHEAGFNEFITIAQSEESSLAATTSSPVTRWLREAFRHVLSIAKLLAQEDREQSLVHLDIARRTAEKLHDRYLKKSHDVGAATAVWEQYRTVSYSLDRYDDRSSDIHYAACLIEAGEYEEADTLLEQATVANDIDHLQLTALLLRSNLIKYRGISGEYPLRIPLLQRGLEVARNIEDVYEDPIWVKRQIADLEHKLGNALGFGKEAKPDEALQHLARAQEIFAELGDFRRVRSVNEQIEVKRYNKMLTADDRKQAIKTLQENLRRLVAPAMRYDAVMHLYELGRLEPDPALRAERFKQAFERAGDYEPVNWHAAINWRMAQVEASPDSFTEVAPELEKYLSNLKSWQSQAWSRRLQRDGLEFLAREFEKIGAYDKALLAARECWTVVQQIARFGEGRKDPRRRRKIAQLYGGIALEQRLLTEARAVATSVIDDVGGDSTSVSSMNKEELEDFFSIIGKEDV